MGKGDAFHKAKRQNDTNDEQIVVFARSGIGRERKSGNPVPTVKLALSGGRLDGEQLGLFPPSEIRKLAVEMIQAADAAEHDWAVLSLLTSTAEGGLGLPFEAGARFLQEIGMLREVLEDVNDYENGSPRT